MASKIEENQDDRPSWWSRIDITCPDDFTEAEEFAKSTGRHEQLVSLLGRLAMKETKDDSLTFFGRPIEDIRVRIFHDFAPLSFGFVMQIKADGEWENVMNGGLIYHGPHDRGGDGGAPTYSVNVSPHDGWSIHT